MTVFARPNAAFRAYERMLARKPRSWPPTTHDAPTLWGRARALCAEIVTFVRSASTLGQRWRLGRKERREILNRVDPVENLVRTLCLVEASAWLLTPEGRALRAATPQAAPPAAPPPAFVAKPTHKITIALPGWHTIAALRPRIDPRVVEREQREALAAASQSIEAVAKPAQLTESFSGLTRDSFSVSPRTIATAKKRSPAQPTTDLHQPPPHGVRGFQIVRWRHPEPEEAPPPPPQPVKGRLLLALPAEDSTFDLLGDLTQSATHRAPREACPAATALARRIDALQRVLADPAPVIRRLIRLLASLPEDCLPEPWLARIQSLPWWHGRPETHNAMNLLIPLMADVRATHPARPHDPG